VARGPAMSTASLSAVTRYVRHLSARDLRALTDRQLLDRFTLQQEEEAFTELVRRHGPLVLSVCRRVLGNSHDAEDAFQAAFLVLVKKAGSIRQGDSIAGWLYRVAHRLALRARALGDRRRKQLVPLRDVAAGPDLPQDGLATSLDEEVRRLPEQYRSAVVLCYLEGRTQAEAARMLATTADAVNSRLKRARELLRQRLTRRGLLLSTAAVAGALAASAARAALPQALVWRTARTALGAATNGRSACRPSALADALARGALQPMTTTKVKILSALALALTLLLTCALAVPAPVLGDDPPASAPEGGKRPPAQVGEKPVPRPGDKQKPQFSCILLWMDGGPSQIDTFDPKPNHANGKLFKAIDTNVKGIQVSEVLPRLARQMHHLAIIRSLTHREGDHGRGTYLMRTGYPVDGMTEYPALPCVLAKELGNGRKAAGSAGKEKLRPAAPADAQQIARLIGDLKGKQFGARQKAMQELEKLGHAAEPALRKALADGPMLELRQRIEQLLQKLEGPELPRYFSIAPAAHFSPLAFRPGFLGAQYAPLTLGGGRFGGPQDVGDVLRLPPVEAFEALAKGRGGQHRKAVARAFDLAEEKAEVRDAYGRTVFGQGCLLARRLVEQGVPVVEVGMQGWDTHGDAVNQVKNRAAVLDAAWSALLKDLHERKKLDTTLIVWMGEFGRTPRINTQLGRDHWPMGFSVVLAGCGIKGGQVIGKTSADATRVEERPVTPAELHATIYQALGIDPTKENRANTGRQVPLVEKGARAVKEALR
jgi:RNA polymerase sigma factor (sigma-70 family)